MKTRTAGQNWLARWEAAVEEHGEVYPFLQPDDPDQGRIRVKRGEVSAQEVGEVSAPVVSYRPDHDDDYDDDDRPTPVERHMIRLLHRIEERLMTEQDSIDADTAMLTDLSAKVATVITEIDALKAANPSVSTTALDAAVAALGTGVDAAVADAAPPAPPATP